MNTALTAQNIKTSGYSINLWDVAVIIPTFNASQQWRNLRHALDCQGVSPGQIIIIDSSSSDDTPQLAKEAGYYLLSISKTEFGHGKTRQIAWMHAPWAEILIYLTQDAIPSDVDTFRHLVETFDDPTIGAAYGRQLPRPGATALEYHARIFNYPNEPYVRSFEDRREYGFKTIFFSNSFAAYRRSALEEVGGFSSDALVSEEVSVAARMLVAGWKIAYNANAAVVHSHQLSITAECSRYFDIAVQHERERWIIDTFGSVNGCGWKFVISQLGFLLKHAPFSIPCALVRLVGKWCAYQIGRREKFLPFYLKRHLSSQPGFWWNRATHST